MEQFFALENVQLEGVEEEPFRDPSLIDVEDVVKSSDEASLE